MEGGAALRLGTGGARHRKVAVGGTISWILRFSGSRSTNRHPLCPSTLLTSFPRSRAGFPWRLVSQGAQLFFDIKRLVHFLVPGVPFRGSSQQVSVSVRFQPSRLDFGGHLLE
jgi:hypothetical protein